MDFNKWAKGYDGLREILVEFSDNESLVDILLFNEVIKFELMTEMKKVSDNGFKKKDVNQFKKYVQRFNEIINEETN